MPRFGAAEASRAWEGVGGGGAEDLSLGAFNLPSRRDQEGEGAVLRNGFCHPQVERLFPWSGSAGLLRGGRGVEDREVRQHREQQGPQLFELLVRSFVAEYRGLGGLRVEIVPASHRDC